MTPLFKKVQECVCVCVISSLDKAEGRVLPERKDRSGWAVGRELTVKEGATRICAGEKQQPQQNIKTQKQNQKKTQLGDKYSIIHKLWNKISTGL